MPQLIFFVILLGCFGSSVGRSAAIARVFNETVFSWLLTKRMVGWLGVHCVNSTSSTGGSNLDGRLLLRRTLPEFTNQPDNSVPAMVSW